MVNKAALGVIAVIVVAVLGGGFLLGTVMDDSDTPPANESDGTNDDGPATTATATNATGNRTATSTSTEADDGTRTPTLARRFNSSALADNVTREVNDIRGAANVDAVTTEGRTANTLHRMADDHSRDMADAGRVAQDVGGDNVSERYRANEVFETCKYSDDINVFWPGGNKRFVVAGQGTIGDFTYDNGTQIYVENESHAARLIVEEFRRNQDDVEAMENRYFHRVGVDAEITRSNEVFVSMFFCN